MENTQKTPAELFAAQALAAQVREELTSNILPFWMQKMPVPDGGFLGRIDGNGKTDAEAPRGAIMNARLLWTFASAYRILKNSAYLQIAQRAKREIIDRFYDKEYGGVFWSLDPDGTPRDTKKQIYAIGFAIYGLSELYRASGDEEALEYAVKLFHDIEEHSFDKEKNGYLEAFTREWGKIEDMRLSEKDANESKTMNTHLHIIEPYTNLFRVWKDPYLKSQLANLLNLFLNTICGEGGHLRLFFDEDWNCHGDIVSYGHDIEASWLLHETALELGDGAMLARAEQAVSHIVAAASEGFDGERGMAYEKCGGHLDADRHWWVQAEAVVGYFNFWQHFGEIEGLENALMCWDFIKENIIDQEGGEWFWSLRADGTVNKDDDKAGFWKCPYHNGRMCMEIIERIKSL